MEWEASITIRVRYAETDQMGVVHHANHLIWFESARSELCRLRGLPYSEMEKRGLYLPVVEAHCRYRAAARYDDEIRIQIGIMERTRRTIRFGYRADRRDDTIAEGETLQMLVDADARPRSFPDDIAAMLDSAPTDASGIRGSDTPCA